MVLLGVLGAIGGAVLASALHAQTILFVALGAVLPVLKLLATPQHIDAWRSGAAGEREVGARLDKLRTAGVLILHDRRVPGRRTNIDHIAVSPAGVFVIDTKNVAGKVSATRKGLHVAGRRRDAMVTGVQGQIAVVRQALDDQPLSPDDIRGVLCFSRAELPLVPAHPRRHCPAESQRSCAHAAQTGTAEPRPSPPPRHGARATPAHRLKRAA